MSDDIASREIELTLHEGRVRAEYRIARYRVVADSVLFIAILALAPVVHSWVAVAIAGAQLAFALGVLWLAPRLADATQLAVPTLLSDLIWNAAFYVVAPRFLATCEDARWTDMMAPAGIFLALTANLLRYSRPSAVIGLIAGPLSFVGIAYFSSRGAFPQCAEQSKLGPYHVMVATALMVHGGAGILAARWAGENLNAFARVQLLRRYLPSAAVDRVLGDPSKAFSLGGRSVDVTLLASDLRGFTALSEKLPPQEVLTQLNAFHAAMLAEVDRHGGMLDKFIGDGMLAVFGMPLAGEAPTDSGAAAAIACSRDMLVALHRLNGERESAGLSRLAIGIGVHSGSVVAGNLGAPGTRLEFTVIGDAVNTAARLEALTKERETPVIVSGRTAALSQSTAGLVSIAPAKLRGREEELALFRLA